MASFLFSLIISLILTLSLRPPSGSAFTPSKSYFLNCGSPAAASPGDDNPRRSFIPDDPYLSPSSTSQTLPASPATTSSSPLYSTARLFTAASSYLFSTSSSHGTYILRLHFAPLASHSAANFSVSALGRFALLTDFSVPGSLVSIKEYYLSVDVDQFTLTFTPNSEAFVNAIELFTAPPELIDDASPYYITDGSQDRLPNPGLETLYRVNVGGQKVTPANDTLWRTWLPDDPPFMFNPNFSSVNVTSASAVKYGISDQRRTPEIAPPTVYASARIMSVAPLLSPGYTDFNFNLTWSFNVSPGKTHFVRLHFCDFVFIPVAQLIFNLYIGRELAQGDLQPFLYTDQTPAAAFYLDFAIDSDDSGLLNVSIGRSNRSTASTANALLNGLEIMRLGLDSVPPTTSGKTAALTIILCSIGGGVVVLVLVMGAAVLICRRRRRKTTEHLKTLPTASWSPFRPETTANSSIRSISINTLRTDFELQIPLEEIRLATDDFDDKLVIGSGGFGKVYKGMLSDGRKVAVKRATLGSRQGYPEFQTEIELLSRIRHRHLVSLIGYCNDQSEMILVYEYMERGPLRNHLYGPGDLPCLSWTQRLEMCIGAARGLHYLHTSHSHSIIHRDIKSTNILLADDYLAKVADFGLSRIGPSMSQTHVSTGVKGTFGYLDPEYFKLQKLTSKSDVYSFGAMMFEVLCARPVIDMNLSRERVNLSEWAVAWQRRGKLERIVDPRISGQINGNSLRKFGETAAKCLEEYGVDRPTIGDVLWNLEYALQLQTTELRREPFEDSGNMEADVHVNVVRPEPSNVVMEEGGDEEEEARLSTTTVSEGQSGVSASMVFSQLFNGGTGR